MVLFYRIETQILTKIISVVQSRNYISDSPHYCGNLYQCAIGHAELNLELNLEVNLELILTAISLFKCRNGQGIIIVNMLLYEDG